ncbi:MAG: hypothetical protein M5U26_09650 [Planctomycetota bacterium]|nr:hypothetical protein [Planctomycetota bacterium]
MRYFLGKLLEVAGMILVGWALFAGLGITPSGHPDVASEYLYLFLGSAVFTAGWLLERSARAS